jgi:hypothetical protein
VIKNENVAQELLEQGLSSGTQIEHVCVLLALITSFVALWWISYFNYVLFHSLVEIYNVMVLWGVFFVTWSVRRFFRNS